MFSFGGELGTVHNQVLDVRFSVATMSHSGLPQLMLGSFLCWFLDELLNARNTFIHSQVSSSNFRFFRNSDSRFLPGNAAPWSASPSIMILGINNLLEGMLFSMATFLGTGLKLAGYQLLLYHRRNKRLFDTASTFLLVRTSIGHWLIFIILTKSNAYT